MTKPSPYCVLNNDYIPRRIQPQMWDVPASLSKSRGASAALWVLPCPGEVNGASGAPLHAAAVQEGLSWACCQGGVTELWCNKDEATNTVRRPFLAHLPLPLPLKKSLNFVLLVCTAQDICKINFFIDDLYPGKLKTNWPFSSIK